MLGSLLVDEDHCLRIARYESALEYDSYDVQELNDECNLPQGAACT